MSEQGPGRQRISGPDTFEAALRVETNRWQRDGLVGRLWAKDATLWTGGDEARWMDWLNIVATQRARLGHFAELTTLVAGEFTDAVILGMGGSSLCPHVLARSFGRIADAPTLHILDSTDPVQVARLEGSIDLQQSLFIVASKSGTPLEADLLCQYFFDRMKGQFGERAGEHFMAITDPGSKLETAARRGGFRSVVHGLPGSGGRFSALSDFGMVPAAILGLDVDQLLTRAATMVELCGPATSAEENPGVRLGLALGLAGAVGRNKVTISASPGIRALGPWLEQLIGESTGKDGRGLIPVDGEKLGKPDAYGDDRLFVSIQLDSDNATGLVEVVDALESAGHPVIRITLRDVYDLGQEFFRWEIAVAVAGAVLRLNPFDQPDVEVSKIATQALVDEFGSCGSLPVEISRAETADLRLFANDPYWATLKGATVSVDGLLRALLHGLGRGDYFALLAYIDMNPAHTELLGRIRHAVRDVKGVATCVSFGPRYLHSIGQVYKGGPNSGVFLQITADDSVDLPIPGRACSFGVIKAIQARGDFAVLGERRRRALRVHVGSDVASGLAVLERAVYQSLEA